MNEISTREIKELYKELTLVANFVKASSSAESLIMLESVAKNPVPGISTGIPSWPKELSEEEPGS